MAQGEVYLVGVLEGCYKIGRSGDSERRILDYAPKLPVTLTIIHRITTNDAVWLESVLHGAFLHRRSVGEWFRLSSSDVEWITSLVSVARTDTLPEWLTTLLHSHAWVDRHEDKSCDDPVSPTTVTRPVNSPKTDLLDTTPSAKGAVGRPPTLPPGERYGVRCTVVGEEIELVRMAAKKVGLTQLQLARDALLLTRCRQIIAEHSPPGSV